MKIEIQRNETSQPIVYTDVINAYTKGRMYCVLFVHNGKRVTHKYPLETLFRVIEDYPESKRDSTTKQLLFQKKEKEEFGKDSYPAGPAN